MSILKTPLSISELKTLFHAGKFNDAYVDTLRKDSRKGVQQLIKAFERQKAEWMKLEKRFIQMTCYEQRAKEAGKKYIAGVDEAGRGPLAGPVVAAAVILPLNFKLLGLNDSKKLTRSERKQYFEIIKEKAISYEVSVITNNEIDHINILEATKKAMRLAITSLHIQPEHVLIDAVELSLKDITTESIIKGDQKSISIAAASILAKETRDVLMEELHEQYPEYGFIQHMGYGTKAHLENLAKYGASPVHRKSFAPVKKSMG